MQPSLAQVFEKDINKLIAELELNENEDLLWQKLEGTSNPAGNLFMHLIGNLRHFVSLRLGNIPYERNRPFEFSGKMSKHEIHALILQTKNEVIDTISKLTHEQLAQNYAEEVFGKPMQTDYFLFHLLGHLNYHLGQINFHRRAVCYK